MRDIFFIVFIAAIIAGYAYLTVRFHYDVKKHGIRPYIERIWCGEECK